MGRRRERMTLFHFIDLLQEIIIYTRSANAGSINGVTPRGTGNSWRPGFIFIWVKFGALMVTAIKLIRKLASERFFPPTSTPKNATPLFSWPATIS